VLQKSSPYPWLQCCVLLCGWRAFIFSSIIYMIPIAPEYFQEFFLYFFNHQSILHFLVFWQDSIDFMCWLFTYYVTIVFHRIFVQRDWINRRCS
jgi:hypothetical protein